MTTSELTLDQRAIDARSQLIQVREVRAWTVPSAFELREKPNGTGGTTLTFTGYACATDQGYEMYDYAGPYTEVVRSGAFTKTLSEGADVAFLVNHEGLSLARTKSGTLTLSEDGEGLLSVAEFDPTVAAVQHLRSAVERGDVDQMSFAFRVLRQQWSPDWDQRDIIEVDLNRGDVSAVTFGANPHTSIGSLRSLLPDELTGRAFVDAVRALTDGTPSEVSQRVLAELLPVVARDDEPVDELAEALAGLVNPDPTADILQRLRVDEADLYAKRLI